MRFILTLILLTDGGARSALDHQEYVTKEACVAASNTIVEAIDDRASRLTIIAVCTWNGRPHNSLDIGVLQ